MHRYLFYVSELYSLGILRPLQKVITERADQAAWFFEPGSVGRKWLSEDEVLLPTVDSVKNYNPDAVFVPGNVVPDFFPGLKVQVFHGLADDSMGKKGHYRIRGFFDLYCTRGEEETRIFQKMASKYGHFQTAMTGWPKLDPLFQNRIKDLRQEIGTAKPVVLYASTFSPSMTSAPYLLETIRSLSEKGDYHWLVTLHPKMPASIVDQYRNLAGPNLSFYESHEEIWPLLKTADVMLCDTSSIMLEFMLMGKPVVTYRSRKPVSCLIDVSNAADIETALAHALAYPKDLMSAVNEFACRLHPHRDGRSSERVLATADRLITGGTGELKARPLNLLRKIKIRKKLGYYRMH
ncbi:MAG: CDP-glycerol glycerophosphotransferase family protein [Desulfobacterales bacterium]